MIDMGTWKPTKGHHWINNTGDNIVGKRKDIPILEAAYGEYTTPMGGLTHVKAHRDAKEFGPIGAVAIYTKDCIVEGDGFIMY
jgi:hypothetical protein